MTTDNKTPSAVWAEQELAKEMQPFYKALAVDVLAVMDHLRSEWRDESQIVGRWDSADALDTVHAAVTELIEAVDKHLFAIRQMDEAMHDGINVQGAVSAAIGTEEMLRSALARVKGESA